MMLSLKSPVWSDISRYQMLERSFGGEPIVIFEYSNILYIEELISKF